MSAAVGFIPARLGSTRFPGKVLADRTGMPLIRHVWESARGAKSLTRLVVATDDERVAESARGFGAEAVLTGADHPNGTSRIAEAAAKLGLEDDRLVVNVQGDEPELEPGVIDESVRSLLALEGAGACVGTCASPMDPGENAGDPNVVKVVRDRRGMAMYFSRAEIPFDRDAAGSIVRLRHVGVYAYRRAFLERYLRMEPTDAERAERLEQLRVLEHGHGIAVGVYKTRQTGIDTPEQYTAFVERWRSRRAGGA
ncbi:MAG: 3-deoxy-manno-octulosonate cytidylyltransferase [Phycisphaerales bacterium]